MTNLKRLKRLGFEYVCGVDEAGRGPLAGPMSLGFFVVSIEKYNEVFKLLLKAGLNDSKKIKEENREKLFEMIKKTKGKYFNAMISAKEIDKKGISKCMQILIKKLLYRLNLHRTYFLLDGAIKFPDNIAHEVIIKGDSKEPTIMAGSIVAKVLRDREMRKMAKIYPQYDFEIHKGYGTLKHRSLIQKYGLCEIHRKSFCKKYILPK